MANQISTNFACADPFTHYVLLQASFCQRSVSENYYYSESLPGAYDQDASLYASTPTRYSSYDDSLIYPPYLQVDPRWFYESERRRTSLQMRSNVTAPIANAELYELKSSASTLGEESGQRMKQVEKTSKSKGRVNTREMSASQQTSFDAPTCTMSDGSRNSSNNSVGTLRLRSLNNGNSASNQRNGTAAATSSDAEEIFRHFLVILTILTRKLWQLCRFLWQQDLPRRLLQWAERKPLLLATLLAVLTVSLWLGYTGTL
ncbi:hypothetical protein Ciccas_010715 [Cichlidogyrus casuarinus]|uniref:Uncharacterized protein n=1 Tax=Cichlidogyrus casuarinus TaxID=1844966 RepID=A0ABD2PTS1_9PLAT